MANVKVCPSCGTQNDERFLFCKACGTPIENVEATVIGQDSSTVTSTLTKAVHPNKSNPVANIIQIFALITYAAAFLVGIILCNTFGGGLMFVCWIVGFFTGSMLLGFSEIISLLSDIKQELKQK